MMLRTLIILICITTLAITPLRAQTTAPATEPATERSQISRAELFRRGDAAVRKGVKFLLSRQNPNGSWSGEGAADQEIGTTALVTLALLYCGQSHQEPALDRAIKFLKKAQPQRIRPATYSIALRAAVYASLPEPMRKQELQADLRWLQAAAIKQGPGQGMYTYGLGTARRPDYSNSQYGVLGVWYAAQAGLEVPRSFWKLIEDGWLNGQNQDGGWPYHIREQSYASMTAAGAATLFITNDYLHTAKMRDLDQTDNANTSLDLAMRWIAEHFAPDTNFGKEEDQGRGDRAVIDMLGNLGKEPGYAINYMLFGFERVGEASGLTRFGDHKWFDEGAQYLLETQGYDGGWLGERLIGPQANTAYALLFLSRGRAPVALQKLQFDGRWNNRPRDVSAFAQFMRRATERHINWQIITFDNPSEEFRDATMLYAASDRAMTLSDTKRQQIKTYLDQGGLLVCVNEGDGDEFTKSILALGSQMYPAYKFRDAPANHLLYTANFPVSSGEMIKTLSNGVRDLIVLYPTGDMSWKWLSANGAFAAKDSPYASLANLWLYATDRANPRFKGEDIWVENNPGVTTTRTITIARIRHNANWNPEPGGWERLANILHNFEQINVKVEPTLDPKGAVLAHLTSTNSVQLPATSKLAIKQYLDGGGMLLLDAAGGSAEAAGSFDALLRELYPTIIVTPLPLDHRIYHATTFGGAEIESVTYRRTKDLTPVRIPRLRGATVNGKLVAIVSNEDLSGALVGYQTAGLNGYMPTSAVDLVRNIILWRMSPTK